MPFSAKLITTNVDELLYAIAPYSTKEQMEAIELKCVSALAGGFRERVVSTLKTVNIFKLPIHPHITSSILAIDAEPGNPVAKVIIAKSKRQRGKPAQIKGVRGAGLYIAPHIPALHERHRDVKWFEKELRVRGILPAGWFLVPRENTMFFSKSKTGKKNYSKKFFHGLLDVLEKNRLRKLRPRQPRKGKGLLQTKTRYTRGYRGYRFFTTSIRHRTLKPGIWSETTRKQAQIKGTKAGGLNFVFSFVSQVAYTRKPFPFFAWADEYIDQEMVNKFRNAVEIIRRRGFARATIPYPHMYRGEVTPYIY